MRGTLEGHRAWAFVIVILVVWIWLAIQDSRKDRASRRSSVGSKQISYGVGGGYRPRSALWTGPMMIWLSSTTATMLIVLQTFDSGSSISVYLTLITAALTALFLVFGIRSLADFVRTAIVGGVVLERKITYSGEDREIRNYWIALDDGSGASSIAGIPISEADHAKVVSGARVRLRVTPRGRQVKHVEIVSVPASANPFPAELAALFPRGIEDLVVSPAQAAKALYSPVEFVAVATEVPNARSYLYVPPGSRVVNGTATPPSLRVTEAFDAEAASAIAELETVHSKKKWHPGNTGVFQAGMTYIIAWGDGAVIIHGHMGSINDKNQIGLLAYSLKAPKPA